MKIVENGNFTRWFRVCIFVCGVFFGYLGLELESFPIGLRVFLFLIGVIFAAIGGYASQANTLKIRPFDTGYKKARQSYEQEKDKS